MVRGSERLRELIREDTVLRAYMLLLHISHIVQEYTSNRLYRELGISEVQFRALGTIALNGGSMRPSELSMELSRVQHNITTLISRLHTGGFVTTERDSRDKRYVNINITDRGREIVSRAYPVSKKIVSEVMSSVSEEDAVELEKVLCVIEQNLPR